MEHHNNNVPWQQLAREKGANLKYVGISEDGQLLRQDVDQHLEEGTVKLFAVNQVSNVLGTINPIRELAREAHKYGCKVLVDGAQSVPHMPIDVQDLDCDFLAFSGHNMCATTGIGVLYGNRALRQTMEPDQAGGAWPNEDHLYEAT